MAIIKSNILPEPIQKALKDAGIEGFEIGSVWIEQSYSYFYVRRITGIEHTKNGTRILYQDLKDRESVSWGDELGISLNDWKRECGIKIDKPFSEYREEANKVLSGEISIESFQDKESDTVTSETSLVGRNSKETLTALQTTLQEKYKRVELVKAFVGYEIERRKRDLEKIKDQLGGVMKAFEKKIEKIMKVITTIELYLGIDEELFQLQDGPKASAETPISFRQMVLFMDEETAEDEKLGKVKWGGLDFQDIDKFDEFLVKNNNFKKLIPEEKGMLVFRPRRYDKKYGEGDPYGSALKNAHNRMLTYFLIRNGETLYRIFTDKIIILDRLFPQRSELDKLLKEADKVMQEASEYRKEEAKEKVEDAFYRYRKQAIFLQGLIDRTEIFHPLPMQGLSVFKMDDESQSKYFNFIYDDEATLPSGRLSFKQWMRKNNEKIEHGSRIVLTGDYSSYSNKVSDFTDRIFRYVNHYNAPPLPNQGVYEVEKTYEEVTEDFPHYYVDELEEKGLLIKKGKAVDRFHIGYETHDGHEKPREGVKINTYKKNNSTYIESYSCTVKREVLTIMHNPKDEAYRGWGAWESTVRKNRIRWRIYKNDAFVMNYDQISLEDIEFYLYNRTDRKNYLDMMPVLRTLKQWRLQELEQEKSFVKMTVGQLLSTNLLEHEIEKLVWSAVEWWKFKNKIKRPIDKDDAKALRMIKKHILKQLK